MLRCYLLIWKYKVNSKGLLYIREDLAVVLHGLLVVLMSNKNSDHVCSAPRYDARFSVCGPGSSISMASVERSAPRSSDTFTFSASMFT